MPLNRPPLTTSCCGSAVSLPLGGYSLCDRRVFESRMRFRWRRQFFHALATLFQIGVNVSQELAGVHGLGRGLSLLDFGHRFWRGL